MAEIIAVKGNKAKATKGAGTWGRSGRNKVQASESPLPVASRKMYLIPPVTIRNGMCEMSVRETH